MPTDLADLEIGESPSFSLGDRRNLGVVVIHAQLDDYGLEPDEFRVYFSLARRAANGGEARVSVRSLAETTRLSERRVRYVLRFLVKARLIRRSGLEDGGLPRYDLSPAASWVDSGRLEALRQEIYSNRSGSAAPESIPEPQPQPASQPQPEPQSARPDPEPAPRPAPKPGPEPAQVWYKKSIGEALRGAPEPRRELVLALEERRGWDDLHALLRPRARDALAWTAWLDRLVANYQAHGERYLDALEQARERLAANPNVENPFAWVARVALNIVEGRPGPQRPKSFRPAEPAISLGGISVD